MRKRLLFGIWFLLFWVSAFGQSGIQVRGTAGISGSMVARKETLVGASSVEMDRVNEFGILISKALGEKFRITSGLSYISGEVEFLPNCPGCFATQALYAHNPDFKMISIPVLGEYSLSKIFYVAAGPSLDFQKSEGNNFSDQSGLGYLVGIGARVQMGGFTLSILPNYKRHGVVPFEKTDRSKFIFQELGIQFGVGYNF